ncbi:hypothetical protein [Nocardia rhizosphaerae]|uniref:DUF4439 domain-containing protein n=1 Tax=Nocardia rhizosphaerae TaxID=1691571 RepID=A0ABV8L828_9NOCA
MVRVPFRHTAPPSAGRPSGMRSDRHGSRPLTSAPARPIVQQHTEPASTPPAFAGPLRSASAAGTAETTAQLPAAPPATARADRDPADVAQRPGWRRRAVLRAFGTGAVAIPVVSALAACAEDDTVHAPDPLAAHEILARADAAAAQAAIALAPQYQDALTTIAAERGAHADALRTEIDRVIGVYGDGTTPVHRTGEVMVPAPDGRSVPAAVAETPTQPLTLTQLRDQLIHSQQSAAATARTQSGYRAGLLASISACCATQAGVLLT